MRSIASLLQTNTYLFECILTAEVFGCIANNLDDSDLLRLKRVSKRCLEAVSLTFDMRNKTGIYFSPIANGSEIYKYITAREESYFLLKKFLVFSDIVAAARLGRAVDAQWRQLLRGVKFAPPQLQYALAKQTLLPVPAVNCSSTDVFNTVRRVIKQRNTQFLGDLILLAIDSLLTTEQIAEKGYLKRALAHISHVNERGNSIIPLLILSI